jgi:RNA 2',3'-cyclic 3'-phosphodiesterase
VSALRLFFALWPSEAMQAELARIAGPAVLAAGGRPIPRQNLHATLAFLGSVPENRFPDLGPAAAAVVASWRRRASPAIELPLDCIEHWRRPQILCASARVTPPAATDLASELKDALLAAGFAPDLKPFRAHVTLARKVERARDTQMTPVLWRFDSFALVASETAPLGSSYSVVSSWALD